MPSTRRCGSPSMTARSMNAPGSPSSALQTKYFCSAGCSGRSSTCVPSGSRRRRDREARSPRPSSQSSAGVISRSALASARYPPRAMYSSMLVGVDQAAVRQHPPRLRREERMLVEEGHVAHASRCSSRNCPSTCSPGISPAKTRSRILTTCFACTAEAHPRTAGKLHVEQRLVRAQADAADLDEITHRVPSRPGRPGIASSVLPAPAPRPQVPAPT
jgi:hypothetical protein